MHLENDPYIKKNRCLLIDFTEIYDKRYNTGCTAPKTDQVYPTLNDAKIACTNVPNCEMFYERKVTRSSGSNEHSQGTEFVICGSPAFESVSYSKTMITYVKRSK